MNKVSPLETRPRRQYCCPDHKGHGSISFHRWQYQHPLTRSVSEITERFELEHQWHNFITWPCHFEGTLKLEYRNLKTQPILHQKTLACYQQNTTSCKGRRQKAQSIDWLTEKYFTIGSWDADYFPCGKVSPSSDSISLRGHNTSTTTNHMIYLDQDCSNYVCLPSIWGSL